MQVSWIDAERIKFLVAQLAPQEPCVDEAPQSVELETVPDAAPEPVAEAWGFATDWMEPAPAPPLAATNVMEPADVVPAAEDSQTMPEEPLDDEDEHGRPLHNPAAALPLSRIRDKLRAIRQRATEAGILTRVSEVLPTENTTEIKTSTTVPVAETPDEVVANVQTAAAPAAVTAVLQTPPFEIPPGSRDERLAAFASWARQVLHEDGGHVLVMSDDGEVLWGGEAKAGLVLSTMMAWGSAIRASAMSACETPPVIRQPLASGHVLTVIPCETSGGMIHAAVAAPAGVSDELALILRGALCAAMNATA